MDLQVCAGVCGCVWAHICIHVSIIMCMYMGGCVPRGSLGLEVRPQNWVECFSLAGNSSYLFGYAIRWKIVKIAGFFTIVWKMVLSRNVVKNHMKMGTFRGNEKGTVFTPATIWKGSNLCIVFFSCMGIHQVSPLGACVCARVWYASVRVSAHYCVRVNVW
jgi:hypothetical protein